MSTVKVEVVVAKEVHEIADAVASLVLSIKEKAKEGLTPAEVAQALAENVTKLLVAAEGAEKVGQEWAEDPASVVMAASVLGGKVVGALLPKVPALPPSGAV